MQALTPAEGWQTETPPAPPKGVREHWWFFGTTQKFPDAEFKLSLVENTVLGMCPTGGQRIIFHSAFARPETLVGYWQRVPLPVCPPMPKRDHVGGAPSRAL